MTDEKKLTKGDVIQTIRTSLGLPSSDENVLSESFVVQTPIFTLQTDLLSKKTVQAHLELLDGYVEAINHVSAELDGVDRESANAND